MGEPIKVWLTKYVLSKGIVTEVDAERCNDPELVSIRLTGSAFTSLYRLGRECFDNQADALANAQSRRRARIASLLRQIDKLENLKIRIE